MALPDTLEASHAALRAAYAEVAELKAAAAADAATVEAVEDLVAAADQARADAINALYVAEQRHAAELVEADRRLLLAQSGHARAKDRRRIDGLTAKTRRLFRRVEQLIAKHKEMVAELREARRLLAEYYETVRMLTPLRISTAPCGCVFGILDVTDCSMGGTAHESYVFGVPANNQGIAGLLTLLARRYHEELARIDPRSVKKIL